MKVNDPAALVIKLSVDLEALVTHGFMGGAHSSYASRNVYFDRCHYIMRITVGLGYSKNIRGLQLCLQELFGSFQLNQQIFVIPLWLAIVNCFFLRVSPLIEVM